MNQNRWKVLWAVFGVIAITNIVGLAAQVITGNVLISAGSALLVAAVLALVISRYVGRAIEATHAVVDRINSNDLTALKDIKEKALMGDVISSMNEMGAVLRGDFKNQIGVSAQIDGISEELQSISDLIHQSMENISSSTEITAQNSEKQFEMLQSAKEALGGVVTSLKTMEGDMSHTYEFANETIASTQKGIEDTAAIHETMSQTRDLFIKINGQVEEQANKSKEVTELNQLVTSIAEQTNMLALNASIEAARAGEHGRGFAIVATEVSKLASETNKVSEKISGVIGDLQKGLQEIHTSVEQDLAIVESGYEKAQETIEDFEAVQSSLEQSRALIEGVNKSIHKVCLEGEQIAGEIQTVTNFSEEITSRMEEAASQVMVQSQQTDRLSTSMDQLKESADELMQFVANKVMQGKMLKDVEVVRSRLDNKSVTNEDLDRMTRELGTDVIYVTTTQGAVSHCNEREAIGLNLFEIDPTYQKLIKGTDPYITTPIKHRVEDGKLFKFLAVMGEDKKVYQIGLGVETLLKF